MTAASDPARIKPVTRIVPRDGTAAVRPIAADICAVGPALPPSRARGRTWPKVACDRLHARGGQAVSSMIGTFCGDRVDPRKCVLSACLA